MLRAAGTAPRPRPRPGGSGGTRVAVGIGLAVTAALLWTLTATESPTAPQPVPAASRQPASTTRFDAAEGLRRLEAAADRAAAALTAAERVVVAREAKRLGLETAPPTSLPTERAPTPEPTPPSRPQRPSGGERRPGRRRCRDNPDFSDDLGNDCAAWRKLGAGHCRSHGAEEFNGLSANAACCVCREAKGDSNWGAAAKVSYNVSEESDGECPAELEYPYCGTLGLLPTSLSPEGRQQCQFHWAADTHYLPSPRMLRCAEQRPSAEWAADVERLHRVITALQNPADCGAPFSHYRFGDEDWERHSPRYPPKGPRGAMAWHLARWLPHGHGFNLWMLAKTLGDHWDRGIPMIMSNSPYRFGGGGCGPSWSCMLTNLSRCTMFSTPLDRIALFHGPNPRGLAWPMSEACTPHGVLSVSHGRCICEPGYGMTGFGHMCESVRSEDVRGDAGTKAVVQLVADIRRRSLKEFLTGHMPSVLPNLANIGENNPDATLCPAGRPLKGHPGERAIRPTLKERHGFFWWHAAMLWWLFKDAPLRKQMDGFIAEKGLEPTCVAMHVRRADACKDPTKPWRQCFRLAEYVAEARRMMRMYGLGPQVYIATDDPSTLLEAQAFEGSGLKFVYQTGLSREKYVKLGAVGVDDNQLLDGSTTVSEIHTDLWAMSHCGAFIGTYSSSLGWITYALMTMRRGHYRPMASLDISLYNEREGFGKFVFANRLDKSTTAFWGPRREDAPVRRRSKFRVLTAELELLGAGNDTAAEQAESASALPRRIKIAGPGSPAARRCSDAVSRAAARGAVLLTSTTGPFAAIARDRGWTNTLWSERSSQQRAAHRLPLWVAHENRWDVEHGRQGLQAEILPEPAPECFFDVFEASPNLLPLLRDPHSPFEAIPRIPGTPSLSDTIIDGKALVRKVVAWLFAARQLALGVVLIWVDVDVTISATPVEPLLAFAKERDVSYLPELPCWKEAPDVDTPWELPEICQDWRIDTGIVLFHMTEATQRFMRGVLTCYEGYTLDLAEACLGGSSKGEELCQKQWVLSNLGLNDIYAFALKLHQQPELRHGWLPGRHRGCTEEGGMCYTCAHAGGRGKLVHQDSGPFTHMKGGTGIMAQQHYFKKTHDKEMALPEEFFAHHDSHIDKRLACGDSHARYATAAELARGGERTPFLRIGW